MFVSYHSHQDNSVSLSKDLSALKINEVPLIFLGSNFWWLNRFLEFDDLQKNISNLVNVYSKKNVLNRKNIYHVVVPEKDFYLNKFLKTYSNDSFNLINIITNMFGNNYESLTNSKYIPFTNRVFDLNEFNYYDSHLTTKCYINFFKEIIYSFNNEYRNIYLPFDIKERLYWGDLGKKFIECYQGEKYQMINTDKEIIIDKEFKNNFSNPLRDTRVLIHNEKAKIKKSVLIAGDSHSSLFGNSKFTELFSMVFETTEFIWNPYFIHDTPEDIDFDKYDFVLLEISQRFIFNLPK